jgi:hypothetical protein
MSCFDSLYGYLYLYSLDIRSAEIDTSFVNMCPTGGDNYTGGGGGGDSGKGYNSGGGPK